MPSLTKRTLRPSLILCFLMTFLWAVGQVHTLYAQDEVVEDTLDWRGYYPLQVGNTWEYKEKYGQLNQYTAYERREITGDTLINGQTYYIHTATQYKLDEVDSTLSVHWQATDYVRYDTTHARLYAIPADSARKVDLNRQGWPGSPFIYENTYKPTTCKMDADFGEELKCLSSRGDSNTVYVSGGYYPGHVKDFGEIPNRAGKTFIGGEHTGFRFLHGFGESKGRIVYARVDSQEYGKSKVTYLSTGPQNHGQSATPFKLISTYPNPAHGAFTLQFSVSKPQRVTVAIYNILGRRVRQVALPRISTGQHLHRFKVSELPAGVYVLHLRGISTEVSKSILLAQ